MRLAMRTQQQPHRLQYCVAGRSNRRALRVRAVLQEDPKQIEPAKKHANELDPLKQRLEALLPPSIADAPNRPPRYLTAPPTGEAWYFSYGANLSFETLSRREVKVSQRAPAIVVDNNIHLVFQHRGGYSTLQTLQPGQQPKYKPFMSHVHGVLYQVTKDDMRKLEKREGGYVLTDIEVETYDGWRCKAQTFVSSPLALLHAEVTPTEKYMRVLRDGAAEQYLDPLYQAWLSSIETVPSVGLGAEYFDTPAKYIAYCFLSIVALVVVGFFSQQ